LNLKQPKRKVHHIGISPSYDSFVLVSKLVKSEPMPTLFLLTISILFQNLNKLKENHILKFVLLVRLFKIKKELIARKIECPKKFGRKDKDVRDLSIRPSTLTVNGANAKPYWNAISMYVVER